MNKSDLLKNIELFHSLSADQLAQLSSTLADVNYSKGSIILDENSKPDSLYLIQSGRVELFIREEETREISVSELGPGDCFGEQGLTSLMAGLRKENAKALSDTILLKIAYSEIRKISALNDAFHRALREMSHNHLLKKLQAGSSLYYLTPDMLGDLSQFSTREMEAGTIIFKQDDPADGVYILISGEVDLYQTLETGEEVFIWKIEDSGIFGELGVMQESTRAATAKVGRKSKLIFIPADDFKKLYHSNEKINKIVNALSNVYQNQHRGQVIQFMRKFLGKDSTVSCVHAKDGRRLIATRVIGEFIYSLNQLDVADENIILYKEGDEIQREFRIKDRLLVGFTVYGDWNNLPHAFQMVFDKTPIDNRQRNYFKRRGEILPPRPTTPPAREDLICYCMSISRQNILECIQAGAKDVDTISKMTGAATMCGHCMIRIEALL